MSLPSFGVRKPVTNLMLFCGIILLALYSLTRLGVDSFPQIEPPIISVIASYPGANPEDVEIKVTEELENQLSTTPGIEEITAVSSEGLSLVRLKFAWGTNLDAATNDIRDRIELAKRFLPDIPDEMENPFIFKFNTANIPIVFLGITAEESYRGLYDFIDERLGDALRQLPGVGAVQFQGGGLERQINIWIDRQRLEGYGFSVLDVQNALRRENITQPVGSLKSGMTDYLMRLPGEFASPDEINSVILGERQGRLVYLKDVARVEDGFKEVSTIVRVDRKPALIMMVQKQSGTNTVEVARRVIQKIDEIRRTFPRDVKVTTIFDTSQDIIDSLNSLKQSVWFALVLVILVTWFFLRQFASSAVVALTIPFSLLVSFIYLFLSGKTINVISLSSLAIASGMVVDNAIVVVDNVFRHLERRERPQEAAIFGTTEVYLSIAASTLTTVVVFAPLMFVRGVVGIMFGELAAIVIVTLMASLFTAATFSPMLCSVWLRYDERKKRSRFYLTAERFFVWLENGYARMLTWSLRHRKRVIGVSLAVLAGSLSLGWRFLGTEFLPEEDTGDLRLNIHLAVGTRVEETDKVARFVEDIFSKSVPEARYSYVRSGQIPGMGRAFGNVSGTNIIQAGMKLTPKTARRRSVRQVGQDLRRQILSIPGVLRTDITTGNPIGRLITGGGGKAIQLEIIGHSFEDTNALAAKLKEETEKIPGAVDVSISREARRPELKIEVDRVKAADLGFDMSAIADTVKTYIQGASASKYRERGQTYDIYVRLEEKDRMSVSDIENLPLIKAGKSIPLSSVASVSETLVPEEIERKNRERVVRVEANTFGRSSGDVVKDMQKVVNEIVIPPDIMVQFGGEAEEQRKAFGDLVLLLVLGIALVYMVMAAQFESLLDPFIIMFSVPFTFVGVIIGLIVTRIPLSVISFLGLVMLTGIVVNNAIVLVSYINILRQRGNAMLAAVTEAGRNRLRAVMMTTITTLVGLLPLALSRGEGSESWRPIGVTMLSGLLVSTLITLLFVPTLYTIFESKLKKKHKAEAAA
jgi:HAE1 family hydrophobic/amphiphilic exporter-1